MRSSLPLGALLAHLLVAGTACSSCSSYVPCGEDGVIAGNVYYRDGAFLDPDGFAYATAGGRPFAGCTVIRGDIVLSGDVSDFSDFDFIESVGGFFDLGVNLPAAAMVLSDVTERHEDCGVISGFPRLKEIRYKQMDTSALVDHQEGCFYWDGFAVLEYVGDDFRCRGTESVGQSLVDVVGALHCDNSKLQNLERVGELRLDGAPLPNLVWAGRLFTLDLREAPRIEYPLLREVGSPNGEYNGELRLGAGGATVLDLSSLATVWGDLEIRGFTETPLAGPPEARAETFREMFSEVSVYGRRAICRNGVDDPCPWEPDCTSVHGDASILCCNDDWPECLETYGEPD